MTLAPELVGALEAFARTAAPLLICDYDGTLAPLVDDPDRATANGDSVQALEVLAALADTHVAVVSGRSLRALRALCPLPPVIHLVGSHGSEFTGQLAGDLDESERTLLLQIGHELDRIAESDPGFIVETKPVSVAFHYRKAPVDVADVALDAVRSGPASWPGVKVKNGKMVIELTVIDTDKGTAVERLRRQVGADTVLFVGDDVTDEDGFAVLRDHDVGVKVGAGHSVARYRVDGTDETAELLKMLAELRTAWLARDGSLDGRAL